MALNIEKERVRRRDQTHLTDRESEIIQLIAKGHSNRKVADILVVSKRTIDFHLAHAYRKLGVFNRVQAVLAASRLGLLPRGTAPTPFGDPRGGFEDDLI